MYMYIYIQYINLQGAQTGSGFRPASYSLGSRGLFTRGKSGLCMKLTTHLHPVPSRNRPTTDFFVHTLLFLARSCLRKIPRALWDTAGSLSETKWKDKHLHWRKWKHPGICRICYRLVLLSDLNRWTRQVARVGERWHLRFAFGRCPFINLGRVIDYSQVLLFLHSLSLE
jgi:hypothetical protein